MTQPIAGGVHQGHHSAQDLCGEMEHQLGVFVNERLALGPVGDQKFDLRIRFDRCRKRRPAAPTNAAIPQLLTEHNWTTHVPSVLIFALARGLP